MNSKNSVILTQVCRGQVGKKKDCRKEVVVISFDIPESTKLKVGLRCHYMCITHALPVFSFTAQ